MGGGQELGSPRTVLSAEAELLEGAGLQLARRVVGEAREDDVVEHLDRPSVVAIVEPLPGHGHRSVETSHRRHIANGGFLRSVLPKVRRVAVVPPEVALIDALDVVAYRPVVAVHAPRGLEGWRDLDSVGDLGSCEPLVHQPQRLVMEVRVHVSLGLEVGNGALTAPGRPVVRREDDVEVLAPQGDGLGQVRRPGSSIPDLRAAQRDDVVQGVRGVLSRAQCLEVGEVEVHLRRRFCARGELEDQPDAVDGELLACRCDGHRGLDEGRLTGRHRLPQADADLPVWPLGEGGAVHVRGASSHRRACVDVL